MAEIGEKNADRYPAHNKKRKTPEEIQLYPHLEGTGEKLFFSLRRCWIENKVVK